MAKWSARAALSLMSVVLIGWLIHSTLRHQGRMDEQNQARQAELGRTEKVYALIDVPTSTAWCQELMGEDFELSVGEPGWPKRLGDIEGLERGCDARELGSFGPDTPVYWLRWRYPVAGRWIAVAVPGGDTRVCCKSFIVVAKRKNF